MQSVAEEITTALWEHTDKGEPPEADILPVPPDRREAIRDLLGRRDFLLLWTGQLLSQVGDQCLLIAAITLITNLSASPLALLIPALAMALPQVLFGLVGGAIADRWDRKWVMVVSDSLRAILVLTILLVRTTSDLWILYLAAAGMTMVGSFFYPARNATIPNIVPNRLLLAANGLIQGSYIIALIVGPVAAGIIVELWGWPAAIISESLSFVISAGTILVMRIPPIQNGALRLSETYPPARTVWHDVYQGLVFIRHTAPLRRALPVAGIATLGIGAVILLAIPHLKVRLGAGGLEYGGAMSMLGVGSILGGLLASPFSHRFSLHNLVGVALILAGTAIVAFAFAPTYLIVLLSVVTLGFCIVIARGALDAAIQALSPDEVRGRVQSVVALIVAGGTALAQGLSALLGHFLGVQTVFVAAGIITIGAGIATLYTLQDISVAIRHQLIS